MYLIIIDGIGEGLLIQLFILRCMLLEPSLKPFQGLSVCLLSGKWEGVSGALVKGLHVTKKILWKRGSITQGYFINQAATVSIQLRL